MLRLPKLIFIIFIQIILVSCQTYHENEINEVIQPVKLTAGMSDTLIISDMFYAEDYDLKFLSNESVVIDYNEKEGKVVFTPGMEAEGMTLLDFRYGDDVYQVPVDVKKLAFHTFKLKPFADYEKVTLFGNFNSWNRQQYPMTDDDGDGTLEVTVPLEPGTYQYKFFGDGIEFIDPDNDVKVPNGLGDFNSILVVPDRFIFRTFLHVIDYSKNHSSLVFTFQYEQGSHQEEIIYTNLIPLLNNKKVNEDNIEIIGSQIILSFDSADLKGKQTIRLTVNQNGQNTNTQTIFLEDGKPAGADSDFYWYDAIIYSLMVDRFNDGDPSLNNPVVHDSLSAKANYMGGDLQGILNKINEGYFDSLGINVLWISPVYDNPNEAYKEYPAPHRYYSGYHGYWPIEPESVEEKFGDMDMLKDVINTAHNHNIKVLLDYVSNHVHELHPFYENHRDWFGKLELPDGRLNLRFWEEYRLTTWFEPYLPSFDYINSEEALEVMTDNAVWWLKETGADGYRHDAVKHVPNNFWRRLTRKLNKEIAAPQNKYVYQIGETFGSYELVSSYVNHGQLSSQFNFEIYNIAQSVFADPAVSFARLEAEMQKTFSVYGNLHLMGNVMDSHDKNRFMAYADGDLDLSQGSAIEIGWNNPPRVDHPSSYKKAELYLAFMMTIPGLPVIYYGSEFGMTGASDPDNRRMMRFDDELSDGERTMLQNVSKITKLRAEHSSLRYGDYYPLTADENIYSYIRSDFNERIIVLLNKNENSKNVKISIPEEYEINKAIDLISGENLDVAKSELRVNIDGIEWRMFLLQ